MMDFSTTKIDTIERAKEFFQSLGCSSFHMSREYPNWYDEYRKLGISREIEREWTSDSLAQSAAILRNKKTKRRDLWHIYARTEELVQSLKSPEALREIYEVTEHIGSRLPKRSKVLVAETIIGRSAIKYRSGLIFLASELNELAIARRISEIATQLATSARDSSTEPERSQAALDKCNEIRAMLGLE